MHENKYYLNQYLKMNSLIFTLLDLHSYGSGKDVQLVTYKFDGSDFPANPRTQLSPCGMNGVQITGNNTICNPNNVINNTEG